MGLPPNLITGRTAKFPPEALQALQGERKSARATAEPPRPVETQHRPSGEAAARKKTPSDGMNGWEREYAGYLELLKRCGEILDWRREPVNLRLAKRTYWKPDFLVVLPGGKFRFDEVKGFERNDAVAKFKVAAAHFPFWQFRMVKKKKGSWIVSRELN